MDAEPKKREPESATDEDGSAMSALIAATGALRILRETALGANDETLNINNVEEQLAFASRNENESSHHDGEECDLRHSQLDGNTDNGHEGRQQDDKNYAQVGSGVAESVRSTEIGSESVNPIAVEGLSSSDATPSATANSGEVSFNVRESSQRPTKPKPRRGVSKKTSKQAAERTSEHVPDGLYARTPEPTKQETPVQGHTRTPELAPNGRTQRLLERIRSRTPQPTIEPTNEGTSSTATWSTKPQHHSVAVPASPNENTPKIPVKGNLETLTSKNNDAASPANATPDPIVAVPSAPKKNPGNACHITGAARIVSHSTNNSDLTITERLSTAGPRAHSAHPGTADLTPLSGRSQCRTSKRSVLKEILKQPHLNMRDTPEVSRPFSRMWNALRGVSHRPSVQRQQTARNNQDFLARNKEGPTLNGAAKASKCEPRSMKQELSLPIKTAKKRKTSLAWRFPTLRAILQRPPLNANELPQDSEVSLTTPGEEYPSSYQLVPTRKHGTSEAAILQSDCKENIPPLASELPSCPQHTAMSPERSLVVPDKRVPAPSSTTSVPGVIQASGRGNSSRREAPHQTGRNQPTSDSHRQSASVSSTSHFREQQPSTGGSDTAQATSHEHGQDTQWDKDFQLMLRRYLPRELFECTAPRTRAEPEQQHHGYQSHTTETRGMSRGHQTQTVSKQSSTVPQLASVSSTTTFAQQQESAASSDPTSTMSHGDRKDPQWERDFQLMLRRYLPRELLECTSPTARNQPQGLQHQQQPDTAGTTAESGRDSPWDKEFQRMLRRYLPRELLECTAPSARRQPHEQLTEAAGPSGASNEAVSQRLADLCQAVRARLFAESCLPWSAFVPGREPPQNQLLQKSVPSASPVSNLTRMPRHNQAFDAKLRAVHISQPSTSRAPLKDCLDSGVIVLNQAETKPTSPKATSYREPAVSSSIDTETDGDDDDSMPDLETPSPVDSPVQPDAPSPPHSHGGLEQARAFEAASSSQALPQAQPLHASQFVTLHPCRGELGNAPQTTQTLTRTTSSFTRPLTHQQLLQRRFHPAPHHERGHSTFSPTRMPLPAHRSAMQRPLLHGHSAPRSHFAPARDWEPTSHPGAQHVFQAPLRGISPRQLSNVNLVSFRPPSQAFPRNQGAPSSLTAYAMEGRIRRHSSHETEASRSQERSLKDVLTATRQSASEPDIYPLTPTEQFDASIGSTFKFAECTSFAMDLSPEPLGARKLETDEYKGAWEEHTPEPCVEGLQSSPADEKHDSKDRSATPQKRKPPPPTARSQSDEALETSEKKFQQSPSETPSSERYPLKLTLVRAKQRGSTRFTRKRPPKVEAEEEEEQAEEPQKPGSSREPEIKPPGEGQPSEVHLGASLHPRARSLEALYFPERAEPPSVFYFREPPSDDRRSELRRFAEDIWPE